MVIRIPQTSNRPAWVPDSSATACARCRANFSFELRRHHCRFCGNIFCHYCSSKSRPVLALGYVEPVRVCDVCHEQCALRDAFLEVVRSGDLRATQAMLQHQHVSADDSTGTQTPLLVAASKGHTDVMRVLLDHGANVHGLPHGEELDEEGRLPRGDSPLHYAAINGSLPCVEMLLALDADVNRRSARYGETPLHKAVLFGRCEVARELLKAGASVQHKNDRGFSVVKLCELCGGSEMLDVFRQELPASSPALQPVTAESIAEEFKYYSSEGTGCSDQLRAKGEQLVWNLVVALYLYKRPRRGRALLVEALIAAYKASLPVMAWMPQLCDLALFEPLGDTALKQALVKIALSSCTDAMAISFFMRSSQEAAPRVASNFLEVLDALVFGACPGEGASSRLPPLLQHTASMPALLASAEEAGTKEEHLIGEGTPDGGKALRQAHVHTGKPTRAASGAREGGREHGWDANASGGGHKEGSAELGHDGPWEGQGSEAPSLAHSRSMSSVPDSTSLRDLDAPGGDAASTAALRRRESEGQGSEADGGAGAGSWRGARQVSGADGGSGGGSTSGREAVRGDEDELMSMCKEYKCRWQWVEAAKDRRALLMKSRKFVRVLRELGNKLVDVNPAVRQRELQAALDRLTDRIPPCLYIPLLQRRHPLFYILSLLPEEARVFSTNKRAPFLCVAEVQVISQAIKEAAATQQAAADALGMHNPSPADAESGAGPSAGPGDEEGEEAGLAWHDAMRRPGHLIDDKLWAFQGESEVECWQGDIKMEQLPTAAGSFSQPAAQMQLLEDMYGERWANKRARVRMASPHGQVESWELISFIVKSGDDLRQEQFAMQMVYMFQDMFAKARTRLWLRPYQVVSTAADAGLIEVVQDAVSLHHLRDKWAELKWPPAEQNLHAYFVKAYGPEHLAPFKTAQRNFIESMAAYAVVCYLLKVKDRNDGNLLITRDGHMVHIDFGFMLSNTPGDIGFEQAPFKLTSELVHVMGGKDSASFSYFRELCVQGLLEARKPDNCQRLLLVVEMMSAGLGGHLHLPCVANQPTSTLVSSIKELFMLRRSDEEIRCMVDALIDQSLDNWYTRQYDNYQSLQNAVKNIFFW